MRSAQHGHKKKKKTMYNNYSNWAIRNMGRISYRFHDEKITQNNFTAEASVVLAHANVDDSPNLLCKSDKIYTLAFGYSFTTDPVITIVHSIRVNHLIKTKQTT